MAGLMSASFFFKVLFKADFREELSVLDSPELPATEAAASRALVIFLNKSRTSSAPVPPATESIISSRSPPSSWTDGANLEKRVSSSSGSSTLVIISTMQSAFKGIASIIRGISSASNPNSKEACCIMSRNKSLALSVP